MQKVFFNCRGIPEVGFRLLLHSLYSLLLKIVVCESEREKIGRKEELKKKSTKEIEEKVKRETEIKVKGKLKKRRKREKNKLSLLHHVSGIATVQLEEVWSREILSSHHSLAPVTVTVGTEIQPDWRTQE